MAGFAENCVEYNKLTQGGKLKSTNYKQREYNCKLLIKQKLCMDTQFTNQETKFRTINIYVDIDTGEVLTKEQITEYNFKKRIKKSYVMRIGDGIYCNACAGGGK